MGDILSVCAWYCIYTRTQQTISDTTAKALTPPAVTKVFDKIDTLWKHDSPRRSIEDVTGYLRDIVVGAAKERLVASRFVRFLLSFCCFNVCGILDARFLNPLPCDVCANPARSTRKEILTRLVMDVMDQQSEMVGSPDGPARKTIVTLLRGICSREYTRFHTKV
jgi:hypothetical protein